MTLARMMLVALVVAAFTACGTDDAPADGGGGAGGTTGKGGVGGGGDAGTGGGDAGAGGGNAGSGGGNAGSGGGHAGSGGGGGIVGDVDDCSDFERFFTDKIDPFMIAAFAGGSRFVDGVEKPIEVGFDGQAHVRTYNASSIPPALAGMVTTIELSDDGGGMIIRVPESGFTVFQIYDNDPDESLVRVRRTQDWLVVESPSFGYMLHVSKRRDLGGALEAIPGGGPTLRPALQCKISGGACSTYAVAFDGTLGTASARAASGSATDDLGKTDKGSVWSVRNSSGAREGTCDDPGSARVIGVKNFRWNAQ